MNIDFLLHDQNEFFRQYMAKHIKQKRLSLDYSVNDISSHLHISAQSYRKIESGQKKLNAEILNKLIDFLHLEENDLHNLVQISVIAQGNSFFKELNPNYPS